MNLCYIARQTKSLLCAFVFLFVANHAQAQLLRKINPTDKVPGPDLYLGIKLGANFTAVSGNEWAGKLGSNILGGAYAGVKGLGFGAQAEALFEQSDFTTSDGFYDAFKDQYKKASDSVRSGHFRVSKLSLPIMLQVRVAHLIWLQPGVQFSGIVAVDDPNDLVKDAKQLFKSGAISGVLGATLRGKTLEIGARALYDISNLNSFASGDKWRQFMLQAHVGLRLF